jgi:hypothetical protein
MSKATDRADKAVKVQEFLLTIAMGLLFWFGLLGAAMVGEEIQHQRNLAEVCESFGVCGE